MTKHIKPTNKQRNKQTNNSHGSTIYIHTQYPKISQIQKTVLHLPAIPYLDL